MVTWGWLVELASFARRRIQKRGEIAGILLVALVLGNCAYSAYALTLSTGAVLTAHRTSSDSLAGGLSDTVDVSSATTNATLPNPPF